MLQIRYVIDDIDEFVRREVGEKEVDIDERDRLIAAKYSTIDDVWFAGEPYGTLWMMDDPNGMEIYAFGATVVLYELKRAIAELSAGSGTFQGAFVGGGYGVGLLLDRVDNDVRATRLPSGDVQSGADFIQTGWADFSKAVADYDTRYHTEYLAEATWLLRLEFVRQLRRDAGYPSDHL